MQHGADSATTLAMPASCRVCGLDAEPDEEFDDLLRVIVDWSGASAAEVRFLGSHGWWSKSAVGVLRIRPTGRHPVARFDVRDIDGVTIGELALQGANPPPAMGRLFADRVGRLATSRRRSRSSASTATWYVVASPFGELRAVSPHVVALLGRSPEEAAGANVLDFIHPGDHEHAFDSLTKSAMFPGEQYPLDLRLLHADGTPIVLEVTATVPAEPGDHEIVFEIRETTTRDCGDTVIGAQARLLAMIGRSAALDDVLGEVAAFVDATIPYRAALLLVDQDRRQLRQRGGSSIEQVVLDAMAGAPLAEDSITCGVVAHRGHSGRSPDITIDPAWIARGLDPEACASPTSCWCIPVLPSTGTDALGVLALVAPFGRAPTAHETRVVDLATGIAAVAIERDRREADLRHRALHDPLTGLPNRALFLDRLALATAPRSPGDRHCTAVMLIDLDRFKVINDALGHETGDEVLVAVAGRLASCVSESTTVARFGGDEFTVLCEHLTSPREAMVVARRLLRSVAAPIPLGSGEVKMSMSIGLTIVDTDVDDPGALLRDADAAMYRAKEQGRNRIEVFDTAMRELALARLELERSMHDSIQRGDFAIVCQPEYDLATATIVGAEVLLRWRHPTRGLVSPADFIPIAEETGAILPLGDWVLRRACDESIARREVAAHAELFTTCVNISVVQLLQPGFVRNVVSVLQQTGADPQRIGLEITETALMQEAAEAARTLGKLRDAGLRIAIDDFGTGYSSLSYLRGLPADVVKIDQSFIRPLGRDPQAIPIVAGIVQLAHAVGRTAVAEGIETPEQLAIVRDLGCDIGQGFLLGRPVASGTPLAPVHRFAP